MQVSQPTERCGTPGRHAGLPHLLRWMHECGYTGYYLRILEPGWIAPGDTLRLVERPLPAWTVERLTQALFKDIGDVGLVDTLQGLPHLSQDWKDRLRVLHARWEVRQGAPVS